MGEKAELRLHQATAQSGIDNHLLIPTLQSKIEQTFNTVNSSQQIIAIRHYLKELYQAADLYKNTIDNEQDKKVLKLMQQTCLLMLQNINHYFKAKKINSLLEDLNYLMGLVLLTSAGAAIFGPPAFLPLMIGAGALAMMFLVIPLVEKINELILNQRTKSLERPNQEKGEHGVDYEVFQRQSFFNLPNRLRPLLRLDTPNEAPPAYEEEHVTPSPAY